MSGLSASSNEESNLLSSPSMELLFYFCLFGFFGAIVATSLYLKWQSKQSSHSSHSHISQHNEPSQPQPTVQQPLYHSQQQQQTQQAQQQQQQYQPVQTPQLPPMPVLGRHTQVILDWDDTLFPTAFTQFQLQRGVHSSRSMAASEVAQLRQLSSSVLNLLYGFIQLFGASNVCIVSNAREKWLRESCSLYQSLYGEVLSVLVRQYRIEVISAHDRYDSKKAVAFMDLLREKRGVDQVICIGDSREEYEAIHSVCSVFRSGATGSPRKRHIHYYRLKMLESPSLDAMIRQLDAIQKLDYQSVTNQHFDRSFEFQSAERLQSVH